MGFIFPKGWRGSRAEPPPLCLTDGETEAGDRCQAGWGGHLDFAGLPGARLPLPGGGVLCVRLAGQQVLCMVSMEDSPEHLVPPARPLFLQSHCSGWVVSGGVSLRM